MNDREVTVWWGLTPFGPLVVSRGRGRGAMPLHRHVRRHCTLVLQGRLWEGVSAADARCWEPGDLVVHPPRTRHRSWFPDEEVVVASLRLRSLSAALLGVRAPGVFSGRVGDSIIGGLREALREARDGPSGTTMVTLLGLLDEAFWTARTRTSVPNWLSRVTSELTLDLTARPSLGRLSDLVGKDPTHVSHAFSSAHGMTISQYLARTRVQAAARLLCEPTCSITDAAHLAGFSDSAHLARVFRGLSGATVSQFRRAQGAGRIARLAPAPSLPQSAGLSVRTPV